MCQEALDQAATAIEQADIQLLGEACTQSARIHQRILHKPELPGLIEIADETGGAGVSVAHSGTVVGLLFSPDRAENMARASALIQERFPTSHAMHVEALGAFRKPRKELHARE